MIKHKIIIAIMLFALMNSCQGKIEKNEDFQIINISKTKTRKVTHIPWKQHRLLENINQSDTLKLSSGLISVLKAEYLVRSNSDYESDIIYSSNSIIFNEKLLYKRDSILATGPFCSDHKGTHIGFPVILSQNQDSGVTISDLILLDKYSCQSVVVKTSIDNNANPFFSFDDSKLFFINGKSFFCYNIGEKKSQKLLILNLLMDYSFTLNLYLR